MAKASDGLDTDTGGVRPEDMPCTFISNHRDIVLDSALLSEQLVELGFPTTVEIAIGDNPDENLAPEIILFGEDIEFPE